MINFTLSKIMMFIFMMGMLVVVIMLATSFTPTTEIDVVRSTLRQYSSAAETLATSTDTFCASKHFALSLKFNDVPHDMTIYKNQESEKFSRLVFTIANSFKPDQVIASDSLIFEGDIVFYKNDVRIDEENMVREGRTLPLLNQMTLVKQTAAVNGEISNTLYVILCNTDTCNQVYNQVICQENDNVFQGNCESSVIERRKADISKLSCLIPR